MKIVFLDFDGVLNSTPFLKAQSKAKVYSETGALDPKAVAELNRLSSVVKFVVSSSWRHGYTRQQLQSLLEQIGFSGHIIGRTPIWLTTSDGGIVGAKERGFRIQAWLDKASDYGIDVDSFVILDDNSDMVHLKDRLVQTDMDTGLTESHVDAVIGLLDAARPSIAIPDAETVIRFTS